MGARPSGSTAPRDVRPSCTRLCRCPWRARATWVLTRAAAGCGRNRSGTRSSAALMSRPRWLDELWVAKPLSCLVARKQCDGGVQVHESQSHGFGSSFNAPKDSLKLPRACITMAMAIYFLTIEYCGSYYIILDAELEYIRMRMRIISCNTNTSRNKCTFVVTGRFAQFSSIPTPTVAPRRRTPLQPDSPCRSTRHPTKPRCSCHRGRGSLGTTHCTLLSQNPFA